MFTASANLVLQNLAFLYFCLANNNMNFFKTSGLAFYFDQNYSISFLKKLFDLISNICAE